MGIVEDAREWLDGQDTYECRVKGIAKITAGSCWKYQTSHVRYDHIRESGGRVAHMHHFLSPRYQSCVQCPHWVSDEVHKKSFNSIQRKKNDHDAVVGGAAKRGKQNLVSPVSMMQEESSNPRFSWRKSMRIDGKWKIV